MNYGNDMEYDDFIMDSMEKAIVASFKTDDNNVFVEFYNKSEYLNVKEKVDGKLTIVINDSSNTHQRLNLQIKRSDKYDKSFTIRKGTLDSYIEDDYKVNALLVGVAYNQEMYLFHWKEFIEYAEENCSNWLYGDGSFYRIFIRELINNLHLRRILYIQDDDYYKMVELWDMNNK